MNTQPSRQEDPRSLTDRCISAFVAVLFFAPLLALSWWLFNAWSARTGGSVLPPHLLGAAIIGAAVLGFVLPDATPSIFGWLAEGFARLGRWWWW